LPPHTHAGKRGERAGPLASHDVHFSVSLVGTYWLHVTLRPHGTPVQGSPFKLRVVPGEAHPLWTQLPPSPPPHHAAPAPPFVGSRSPTALPTALPLSSPSTGMLLPAQATLGANVAVGMAMAEGIASSLAEQRYSCELLLIARDKMGNACEGGGAAVTCGLVSNAQHEEAAQSSCVDLGDGTYQLTWWAQTPGARKALVQIDGLHVLGSPALIHLTPEPPVAKPNHQSQQS